MDRYSRVEKPKSESPINENEVRITSGGPVRNYINYAVSLLQEKHAREIVLKAMGQAISKAVSIAEGTKRRNPRLHQETVTSSMSITDVWEPIEEGLLPYQAPQSVEQPKEQHEQQPRQSRGPYNGFRDDSYGQGRVRGRGRGRGQGIGQGRYGYRNYQGNYLGDYRDNRGSGGRRGRSWGYHGGGYERGRGRGGRGDGRGRGRMGGGRGGRRGGGNQSS